MKCGAVTVVLALSLCVTASHCPDPQLQEAAIGANTINGGVVLHKRPVKCAKVRLYSSSGKTAWIGKTDKDGRFKTDQLPPGNYRLEISGWGSTTIHLNPEKTRDSIRHRSGIFYWSTTPACPPFRS